VTLPGVELSADSQESPCTIAVLLQYSFATVSALMHRARDAGADLGPVGLSECRPSAIETAA
jgi:hypothetical protein